VFTIDYHIKASAVSSTQNVSQINIMMHMHFHNLWPSVIKVNQGEIVILI